MVFQVQFLVCLHFWFLVFLREKIGGFLPFWSLFLLSVFYYIFFFRILLLVNILFLFLSFGSFVFLVLFSCRNFVFFFRGFRGYCFYRKSVKETKIYEL